MAIRLLRIGRIDTDTSSGTMFHDELYNRNLDNQHPMSAITGLIPKIVFIEQTINDKKNIIYYDSPDKLPNEWRKGEPALVKSGEKYFFYTFNEDTNLWEIVNEQKEFIFNIADYISSDKENSVVLDTENKILVKQIKMNSHSAQMFFENIHTLDVLVIPKDLDPWYSSIGAYKIWKKIIDETDTYFQAVTPLNYIEEQTKEEIRFVWKDEDCEELKINFEINRSPDAERYLPTTIEKTWTNALYQTQEEIIDTNFLFYNSGWSSIWNSEFVIENLSTEDNPIPLFLRVIDKNIKVMDIELSYNQIQKYNLGISINTKVYVSGHFNANLYIQGL